MIYTGDVDSMEGRLHLVFCCSTRNKTEGLGLEKQKEKNIYRQPIWFSPAFILSPHLLWSCHFWISPSLLLGLGLVFWDLA